MVGPLFAFWAAYRLWPWRPVALGVLSWGVGELGPSAYSHIPHLLGYLGVGLGLAQLPGPPLSLGKRFWPFLLLALLPGLLIAFSASSFLERVYPLLSLALLILFFRSLEAAFGEKTLPGHPQPASSPSALGSASSP